MIGTMPLRDETLEIFKRAFGTEEAYKVMEFIESRLPEDVATRRDIYELKLEIEKVRSDLTLQIQKVQADTRVEIEKMRSGLLKWSFLFWISQMALLAGILFKLLG